MLVFAETSRSLNNPSIIAGRVVTCDVIIIMTTDARSLMINVTTLDVLVILVMVTMVNETTFSVTADNTIMARDTKTTSIAASRSIGGAIVGGKVTLPAIVSAEFVRSLTAA